MGHTESEVRAAQPVGVQKLMSKIRQKGHLFARAFIQSLIQTFPEPLLESGVVLVLGIQREMR